VRRRLRERDHPHADDVSRRGFLGLAAGAVAASLLSGCGLRARSRRPRLTVWSCGGNYDLLLDLNARFEKIAGCRITYSSAPVERLISLLASKSRGVDLLVGRSGPGWADLSQAGRLAGKPQVFALDPYVIIVPPGNPAAITSLRHLKGDGIRTVYSPTSSGPSGKVVQYLLEAADEVLEPGISEGYVRNAIDAYDCGWKVFPPVIEGRAHASITRLSMTTAPETAGKVDVIPIPVRVMAAMREGHGAIPQRAAILAGGPNPELAARYLEALTGELGMEVCQNHGFIHARAPEADDYRPLFRMRAGPAGGGSSQGPLRHQSPAHSRRRQRS
jgi:molybdate transport system substrate-binding protein